MRTPCVKHNRRRSTKILSGAPVFLLCKNDLASVTTLPRSIFADDVKMAGDGSRTKLVRDFAQVIERVINC